MKIDFTKIILTEQYCRIYDEPDWWAKPCMSQTRQDGYAGLILWVGIEDESFIGTSKFYEVVKVNSSKWLSYIEKVLLA